MQVVGRKTRVEKVRKNKNKKPLKVCYVVGEKQQRYSMRLLLVCIHHMLGIELFTIMRLSKYMGLHLAVVTLLTEISAMVSSPAVA